MLEGQGELVGVMHTDVAQVDVAHALDPAFPVPGGFAVPDENQFHTDLPYQSDDPVSIETAAGPVSPREGPGRVGPAGVRGAAISAGHPET